MTTSEAIELKSEIISGKYVNLRIATEADAEFILELRLNPQLNKFIGATDPSVEKQRTWIRNSANNPGDFHFIIEDKAGKRYGTIAVYDVNYDSMTSEWGRWVVAPYSPIFVTIESIVLSLFFAFRKLGLRKLTGGANNLNAAVVAFHKKYGSVSAQDNMHTWFYFEEANFLKALNLYRQFHNLA